LPQVFWPLGTRGMVITFHGWVSVFSSSPSVHVQEGGGQSPKKQRYLNVTGVVKVTQDHSRNGVKRRVMSQMGELLRES